MILKLNYKFAIAFIALTFVMHEAHEIVHTTVGRILCGCWGQRDFNVWGICEDCASNYSVLATFAGPIFTFLMIWVGTYFLKSTNSIRQKSFGFAFIFANLPFARILTASYGAGDEIFGLTRVTGNHTLSWIIGLSFIILVLSYPLYKAFKTIQNKNKIGWFLMFFLVPIIIDIIVVLLIMNTLLSKGVLDSYWILGSPMLVSIWTFFVLTVFILMRKHIFTLGVKD